MNSREKLVRALNHQEGKLPFDLGGTLSTGISASKLYRLRKLFGRDEPVKVFEPFAMTGMVDEQDAEMFGIDILGAYSNYSFFGYRNNSWKEWTLQDGTPALIGSEAGISFKDNRYYMHPKGDFSAAPSGCMPKDGFYFDYLTRQEPYDEDDLDGLRDFAESFEFLKLTDETLRYFEDQVNYLYDNTDRGIVLNAIYNQIGSQTQVFGACAIHTPGIRDYSEWLAAQLMYPEYVNEIYEKWTDISLENLKLLHQAVGNKPQAVFLSTTDLGTQRGEMISPKVFRELYCPHWKKVNDWIHQNTQWKTIYHCCGSIRNFMDDFIESGMDCLNPIQTSAANMDPAELKHAYNDKLVFWGGCVDCQTTLTHGTPDEVEKELRSRIELLGKDGGLVCSIIHNIVHDVPDENILRIFDVLKDYR